MNPTVPLCSEGQLGQIMEALEDVTNQIDTVFSGGCISRVRPDGKVPVKTLLDEIGRSYQRNGKTNVGLGAR